MFGFIVSNGSFVKENKFPSWCRDWVRTPVDSNCFNVLSKGFLIIENKQHNTLFLFPECYKNIIKFDVFLKKIMNCEFEEIQN